MDFTPKKRRNQGDRAVPEPNIAVFDFDTANLPPETRFAAFAASIANSRVTQRGDGPFSCRARFWRIGPLAMSEQWVDAISFDRDIRSVRTTGTDHYQVTIVLEGANTIRGSNGGVPCEAGHAIISDLTLPQTVDADPQHSILIQLPRAFLQEATGPIAIHGLLPRNAAARLFVAHVAALVKTIDQIPESAAAPLANSIRDLLAAALADVPAIAPSEPGGPTLRQRARLYMEQRAQGDLDIAAMCAALGITRPSLYRAFKRDGGVLAYDRRRRLVALHRALADRREPRSLAELGYAFGFLDKSHLSHVFRETFGYTASELRAYYVTQPHDPALPGSVQARYRDVIRSLA